jgi:hypothetical protein
MSALEKAPAYRVVEAGTFILPMESDFLAMDSAEARPSRCTQLACRLAMLPGVLFLSYGLGYWGCADMFGERPRWRGEFGVTGFQFRSPTQLASF